MRSRPVFARGLAFPLALFLPLGWHSALAAGTAEDDGGGCMAADEAARLRCQLDEVRTLVSYQSLVIENKNIELEQKQALIQNVELVHKAVVKDMEGKDALLAQKDALIKDLLAQVALKEAALIKGMEAQEEPRPMGAELVNPYVPREPEGMAARLGNQRAMTEQWQACKRSPRATARPSVQALRDERRDLWRRGQLSKHMIQEEDCEYPGRLNKYLLQKERQRRLLEPPDLLLETTDLPTIIAALPTNTTSISLPSSGLTGTLPADLGRLICLEYLDLSDNQISGSIPEELGSLINLTFIDLGHRFADVGLTGTLPAELEQLVQLTTLSLSFNRLDGTMPSWLGKLTQLTELNLESSGLTGSIPRELGNLANLKILNLGNIYSVGLAGMVPAELGQLVQLTTLDLSFNHLEGTIPSSLGKLTQLTKLDLESSGLAGSIPDELGNLVNLKILNMRNQNAGIAFTGTLPDELGRLVQLTDLSLAYNQFEGTIPSCLGNLTQLFNLDLSYNSLTGTLPADLGRLVGLQYLKLDANRVTGTMPAELGNLAQLNALSIKGNQLTGSMPAELGNLVQLYSLSLTGNQLTGALPAELSHLARVFSISLDFNRLTGTIPPELSNLTYLSSLGLSANELEGTIPPVLGNMLALHFLGLAGNRLSGTIPPELSNVTQLGYLGLSTNGLEGTIPPELGKLENLYYLGLDSNSLDGTVPPDLGKLTWLTTLDLASNKLTGTIPPELAEMRYLSYLGLNGNMLTGTVPPDLGNLTRLSTCHLDGNRLAGQLPTELGSLVNLDTLTLAGNLFTGTLPEAIGRLEALTTLDVSDNPYITGTFPDTTRSNLGSIVAAGCSFTSGGAVGNSVKTMSFASNNLTHLPAAWANLPGVLHLDVSSNQIGEWRPHGVPPTGLFQLGDPYPNCLVRASVLRRLNWPVIQSVNLSGNPFGPSITTRDFIMSLAYLPTLAELHAAGCSLQGVVPQEAAGDTFGIDLDITVAADCTRRTAGGFQGLVTLDLSSNNITSIMSPPPPRLLTADLHSNPLVDLHAAWYNTPSVLEVWNNSLLRAAVTLPSRDIGCLPGGAPTLEANPFGFVTQFGEDAFQCTSLCPGVRTRYKHDAALNVSNLCRCTAGRQGATTNCTGCPAGTYSEAEDQWAMVRTCRPCPEHSSTGPVENASRLDECKCDAGWYMETSAEGAATTPACKQCKQGQFMDSEPGATQDGQCFCNASYAGLLFLRGACGCADGLYMDSVALACKPCDARAEECTWGSAIELSLRPPVVKASYWAAPPPEEASDFSKHDIWRCFSKVTCPGNGTCAGGRSGTACSLCAEGMYGGPDGPCQTCPFSPEDSRKNLLYGLLIGQGTTILLHTVLIFRGAGLVSAAASTLPSLRTSGKQSLNYLQMLGVMGGFNIGWPPVAREFFAEVSRITVALPQVAGAACLTGQQTATLEMGFRWLVPVAGLLSVCLSALVLSPIRCLGHRVRCFRFVHMSYWDVLRVSLWGLALFYSTLLQFGTQVLTCTPGPNGITTVLTFPHLQCNDGGEWARLATMSCAFLLTFVGAVFVGIYAAWRRATRALVESNFASSGWWGFLFDDYRDGWGHWLMVTMAKDAALVAIATAGASDGASQLLATAAVSTAYAYVVLRDQPFRDPSNNFLEAWTLMSVAILSVLTAGLGFQSAPGTDFGGNSASDPEYKRREQALLAVQCLTFIGPAGVMLYQLLGVSDKVRKRLPAVLRPPTQEERANWNRDFLRSVKLDEATAPDLWGVLDRLDVVDSSKFRDFMSTSTATLGVLHGNARGINLKKLVRWRFLTVAKTVELRAASSSLHRLPPAPADDGQDEPPRQEGPTTATHAESKMVVSLGVVFEEPGAVPEGAD